MKKPFVAPSLKKKKYHHPTLPSALHIHGGRKRPFPLLTAGYKARQGREGRKSFLNKAQPPHFPAAPQRSPRPPNPPPQPAPARHAYPQVFPQTAVLLPHREALPRRQFHPRLPGEAGAEAPQHGSLEVGQDTVHVHQHPQRARHAAHAACLCPVTAPGLSNTRESGADLHGTNMHESGRGRRSSVGIPSPHTRVGTRVGSVGNWAYLLRVKRRASNFLAPLQRRVAGAAALQPRQREGRNERQLCSAKVSATVKEY